MSYKKMNKEELLKECEEKGILIDNEDDTTKAELIALLEEKDEIEDKTVDYVKVEEKVVPSTKPFEKNQANFETVKIIRTGKCNLVGLNYINVKQGDILKVEKYVAHYLKVGGFAI